MHQVYSQTKQHTKNDPPSQPNDTLPDVDRLVAFQAQTARKEEKSDDAEAEPDDGHPRPKKERLQNRNDGGI